MATLDNLEWNNSTLLAGDVPEVVGRLEEQESGIILVARSFTLVHTLVTHGLIDEYRLMVFPVLLASGLRCFPETADKTVLTLADSQIFSSGVVVLTYWPAAA